ncbi:MAG: hypothetical protein ABL900_00815, partial [Burkholderiaceae bacterium]
MTKFSIRAISAAVALAAMSASMTTHAESTVQNGAGALSASARLDFRVTIPKVLFLQVGTGTPLATNPNINLIDFVVPAANVGDGSVIAATAASGDLGNGSVTARVLGNNGDVTLTSTTVGALGNGAGDTLSFGLISTTPSVLTSGTALAAPALADGATTSTTVPATGRIVNRDARWTFSFLNTAVVPPGTYGGVNANNSR